MVSASQINESSAQSNLLASLYYSSFKSEIFGYIKNGLQLKLFWKNNCFYFYKFTGFSYFKFKQQLIFFFLSYFLSSFFSYFFSYYFLLFFSFRFYYLLSYLLSYFFFLTTYLIIFRSFPFLIGESTENIFTDLLMLFERLLCLIIGLPTTLILIIYFLLEISLLVILIYNNSKKFTLIKCKNKTVFLRIIYMIKKINKIRKYQFSFY